jgi:hypothetical protein
MLIRLVTDVYKPNKTVEAEKVFGADDLAHPGVSYLHKFTKEFYVGGKVQAISPPIHHDYTALRCSSSLPRPRRIYLTGATHEQTRRPSYALISRSSPGGKLWRFRPVTRCTAPTESSPSERLVSVVPMSLFTRLLV